MQKRHEYISWFTMHDVYLSPSSVNELIYLDGEGMHVSCICMHETQCMYVFPKAMYSLIFYADLKKLLASNCFVHMRLCMPL